MTKYDTKKPASPTPKIPQAVTFKPGLGAKPAASTTQPDGTPANTIPLRRPATLGGTRPFNPIDQLLKQYQSLTPEQREANELLALTSGTAQNAIGPKVSGTLDKTPHLNTLVGNVGRPYLANTLMGTSRNLATLPAGKPDQLANYQMQIISNPQNFISIKRLLQKAHKNGNLDGILKTFQQQSGKTLQTTLGERIRDPNWRAALLRLLPNPISAAQLTRDAFLENLAVGFSYSDASAKSMNTDATPDKRGGLSPQLLKAFGYKAGENQSGNWGLQLRVFLPTKKGQNVIIAFRGTQGVSMNPDNIEGSIDTLIGDFATTQPGINPLLANLDWIERVIKDASSHAKITFVGHSLGGALAQEAAARFPDQTAEVVTFQSANIPKADLDRLNKYNQTHPKNTIKARHYRIDGDVVPTAGTNALPGDIYYFDRMSRTAGSKDPMKITNVNDMVTQQIMNSKPNTSSKEKLQQYVMYQLSQAVPFLSADRMMQGHVIPSLSTYLQTQPNPSKDPKTQALLKYGIRDEQSVPHLINGKNVPAKEEVSAVFAGQYTTAQDPRLKGETARANVLPKAMDITGATAQVFQRNIAYNTALGHLQDAAKNAKDFPTFQTQAQTILNKPTLTMRPFDIQLAKQLHLDKSPRQNAINALNDLTGINKNTKYEAGAAGGVLFGPLVGGSAYNYTSKKYNEFTNSYDTNPVLDQYKNKQGQYEVVITDDISRGLGSEPSLNGIWRRYHPSATK